MSFALISVFPILTTASARYFLHEHYASIRGRTAPRDLRASLGPFRHASPKKMLHRKRLLVFMR
jgi:hypothetical protein